MSARSIPMEEWKCEPSQIKELLDKHNVTSEFSVYRNNSGQMFLMWKKEGHRIEYIRLRVEDWMPELPKTSPIMFGFSNNLWFANSYMPEDISPGLLPYIAMGV